MIRVILVGGIKIFSLFVFFPQNLIFFVKIFFLLNNIFRKDAILLFL